MEKTSRFYTLCDRLSLPTLFLFALECVLGCSGQWLRFGSVSIRMVLFAVCFLLTLPNVLRKMRQLTRTPQVIFTLLYGVYLVAAAIIGWRNGNRLSFIVADFTGCLSLALLPGFLATIHTRHRLARVSDVLFYGALVLGFVTVVLHFWFAFASTDLINAMNNWLNDRAMGGFADLGGVQRIYLRSQIFLQVGLLLGLRKIETTRGAVRWLLYGAEGMLAFACLMSFTRGFWLGFALSAVFLLVLKPLQWKRYLTTVGITAAVVALLFLLSSFAYTKPYAAQRFIGRFDSNLIAGTLLPPDASDSATEPSDPDISDSDEAAVTLRQETLQMLWEKIGNKPLFGNGLGTNLDGLREDGKVEYTYLDVLMKMGIVGFLIFLCLFALPVWLLLKQRLQNWKSGKDGDWGSEEMHKMVLLAAYLGVAVTSAMNPFLLNPMGILLFMQLAAASVCGEIEI